MVTSLALSKEQALMEEKNDIPIVNVLDPGNLPFEKSGPVRSSLVLMGFMLGFLGTLGWLKKDWIYLHFLGLRN
jgi:uncharacterized protein involved in exopolysaccharide biosynthesis